jgi:hypothetical protein
MKMKKLAIALLAGSALMSPAMAEVKAYYHSGGWENYAGINNANVWTCGMGIANRDYSQSIQIKFFLNNGRFEVQIFKASWHIPNDTRVAVEVGFDKEAWGGIKNARGSTIKSGKSTQGMIQFGIENDSVTSFLNSIADSNKMWIRFPDGNETPWTADLSGSRNSVRSLEACVSKAIKAAMASPKGRSSSQPYGDNSTSQPFSQENSEPPAPLSTPPQRKTPTRDEESF